MTKKVTKSQWAKYYEGQGEHPPRKILLEAIVQFAPLPPNRPPRYAIDLGYGKGIETLALLEVGWQVLAIDQEDAAIALLQSRIPTHYPKPHHSTIQLRNSYTPSK